MQDSNNVKLEAFKDFIENTNKSERKLQALKGFIQKGPINIVKQEGNIDVIDQDQIISYLPYNEMVTDEQKKLIGQKRYKDILNAFIHNLQNSLLLNANQFEDLYINDIKSLFLELIKSFYNIYAMAPGIKDED